MDGSIVAMNKYTRMTITITINTVYQTRISYKMLDKSPPQPKYEKPTISHTILILTKIYITLITIQAKIIQINFSHLTKTHYRIVSVSQKFKVTQISVIEFSTILTYLITLSNNQS
jgi:hypothetical protein